MPRHFKPIASFRTKAVLPALATCIAFGFGSIGLVPMNAQAAATDHHTWKIYTNVRFQYSICYPQDLLMPQGEAENSDGQKFLAKDGATLLAFGRNNALHETLKDALADTRSRLTGASGKVTYKVIKPDWFVISGENGKSVFYAKTLYAGQQFKSFELTYNSDTSAVYKPVVTRLTACFANTGP